MRVIAFTPFQRINNKYVCGIGFHLKFPNPS